MGSVIFPFFVLPIEGLCRLILEWSIVHIFRKEVALVLQLLSYRLCVQLDFLSGKIRMGFLQKKDSGLVELALAVGSW